MGNKYMYVNTDGREVVVCQSVEHPGCPPQTNYVRGYIRYGNAVSMELVSVVMGGYTAHRPKVCITSSREIVHLLTGAQDIWRNRWVWTHAG
jgi:hypothetical protein